MATRSPWWLRFLSWLVLALLFHTAYRVWTWKPASPPPPPPPGVEEARTCGQLIKGIATGERIRSWKDSTRQSRQAAWIAAKAEYVLYKTRILDAGVTPKAAVCRDLVKQWSLLHRAMLASRFGADEIPEESGARLRAYWSPVDCTLQTYSITVPKRYDPVVEWPLIVSLHGHGWYRPYQGHPAPAYKGAFGLAPHGRGASDYKDLGENDVLATIAEVCRDFAIDPNRIILRGGSMGGTGSWNVAVHHADLLAGILPLCGNADYRAWSERWGWNAPFEGRNDAMRNLLQEGQTARALAGNLLHVPACVLHGSADPIVPVGHARAMVRDLRRLHCPVHYFEFPNAEHGGFPGALQNEGLAWLLGQPRITTPKHVRWTANLMRHGKAYWIRLEQKLHPLGFARIDALAEGETRVRITTENLAEFSIQRTCGLWRPDKPLFVTVDGRRVIFPADDPRDWVSLRRIASDWYDAARTPAPPQQKTACLEGPIHEALQAPFVLVLGTRAPDALRRQLWAREVYQFLYEWKRRNNALCPFVRDVDCTAAMADTRNLILFGGPRDNDISARLAPALPLEDMLLPLTSPSGGDASTRHFDPARPDVGWFTVFPNPEHPHRLIVMIHGNGPEAIYQVWGRFGNWFNWGVFDSKKYFDYAVFDAVSASPESLLLVGWYGTDWRVDSGIWWLSSPRLRARLAPQQFPAFATAPSTVKQFDLVHLRPERIDHMRGAVSFGRTFMGQPLPGGIAVRAPAVIEYTLDGTWDRILARGILTNPTGVRLTSSREHSEKVRFVIKGDGKTLASATASWDHPPAMLEAEIRGIKTLRLETNPAGGPAWLHMGCAWHRPRLYRQTAPDTGQ